MTTDVTVPPPPPLPPPMSALEATTRAEIDVQVATAKRYPRDAKRAVAHAHALATSSQEVAAECFYVLKRKDGRSGQTKLIEGASIRLAEIFAASWGNIAYGFRAVADDGTAVTVEGIAIDYENNLSVKKQVRRNITDRNGRRYSEDMVTMTTMAAGSIACRNVIFGVIPGVFVDQVLAAARRVALGDVKTLVSRRDAAVKHFEKLGIDQARVLAAIDRTTLEAITLEDVATLHGMATAIREGAATVEESFPAPRPAGAPDAPAAGDGSPADQLARQLAGTDTPASG